MIPENSSPKWAREKRYPNITRIEVVFSQGEAADAVYYVQKGKLKLTVTSEHGKEAVVAILGSGDFFGEGCLNGHPRRIATTTAIDDCVVTRIAKDSMIATTS